MGAKQNRVLNSTINVGAREEIPIPVNCTEQGRWAYKSRRFSDSDMIAAHKVRMNKSVSVMDSLKYDGTYRSDQGRCGMIFISPWKPMYPHPPGL